MANLQERRNKDGKLISYSIRIFRGRGPDGKQLKPFTATFEVKPTWSEKSARKKAEAYAATLEKEVKEGRLENARQRFDQYCDYVLELKKRSGTKQTTLKGYRYLIPRTYKAIPSECVLYATGRRRLWRRAEYGGCQKLTGNFKQ